MVSYVNGQQLFTQYSVLSTLMSSAATLFLKSLGQETDNSNLIRKTDVLVHITKRILNLSVEKY